MKTIEVEGKTVEEAIEKACEMLQASRDQLDVEVVSNPTSGFLGLGAKPAQIRVTLKAQPQAEASMAAPPAAPAGSAVETAKKTLEDILRLLDTPAQVEVREEPERIVLNIQGDGSGLLIGRKGQTLDALEYLVNKIVHKDREGEKRIVVDTENYRKRREESLIKLARRLGEKVKKQGRPVTISPMNAHDRRIIHLALQNDPLLRTRSTGTGTFRRLIISPEKRSS